MSYTWEVSISWGSGTEPDTIRIKDSTGDYTPTINTAIVEKGTGSGVYTANITCAVFGKDYWSIGSGVASPGDAQAVNVVQVNGAAFTPVGATASEIAAALAGFGINISAGIVNGMVIEAIKGDDYSVDTNRQWNFFKIAGEPWPDDLTGHTITLTATLSPDNPAAGDATISLTGTVDVATGDTQQVHVAPTSTQTGTWATGIGSKGYRFKLIATKDGLPKTLREGVMTVRT